MDKQFLRALSPDMASFIEQKRKEWAAMSEEQREENLKQARESLAKYKDGTAAGLAPIFAGAGLRPGESDANTSGKGDTPSIGNGTQSEFAD